MSSPMETPAEALAQLRAERRQHRLQNIDWFDAAYHAYLVGVVGIALTLFVSSVIGDSDVSVASLTNIEAHGPAWLGLVAALALAGGLRSGSRGGPLALEAAEIRYVLMAPVERSIALRSAALKQVRYAAFVGAVVGAVSGQLASKRLPGNPWAWVATGAAFGATCTLIFVGVALISSGHRLARWIASIAALAVLVWAGLDIAGVVPAPTTLLGSFALWPLRVNPVDALGLVLPLVALVVGVLSVGGISLELAERRTGLVGQLRFAVTVQDLRTVIVLRRQLALDRLRTKPYLRMRNRPHFVVWRRGWRGVLRFPLTRLARMAVMGVVAGLCLRGVWGGTTPLMALAALALYIAALDAIEPLAQEVDQSDRTDSYPQIQGDLMLKHVAVPAGVMLIVGLIGAAAALAGGATNTGLTVAIVCFLPAVWAPLSGAVITTLMGAPEPFKDGQLLPPEVAGMKIALRAAWPLIVSVLGTVPVVVAHRTDLDGNEPAAAAAQAATFVLVIVAFTGAWVKYREPARLWWRSFLDQGQQAQRERQQSRGTR